MLYTAAGEDFIHAREAAAEVFATLGWASNGLLEWAVWHNAAPTVHVLSALVGRGPETDRSTRLARALLQRDQD